MNAIKLLAISAIAITISACGDNFEWFPDYQDLSSPTVTATVASQALFDNRTTHVSALPATVAFQANEAALVYYTTNGAAPTTASAFVDITSTAAVTGPTITVTNTTLKFFGVDKSTNKNSSATTTTYIKSP